MDREQRCLICWLAKPDVVELSAWIGVGGCVWPISLRVVWRGTAWHAFENRVPHLALAAEDITCCIMVEVLRRVPLG